MSDRIFGAAMILLALGYALSASTIQIPLFPDPMGPRLFPYIVAAGVALCGAIMVLRPDPDPEWPLMPVLANLAVAALVMVAYAYALKPLGFLIPTALAATVLSYQLSPRPLPALLTGVGLSVGLFVLFRYILGLSLMPVPKGWF